MTEQKVRESGTVRLIVSTPEGLRSIEAPDRPEVWQCVEAYDLLHGTRLYDLDEADIWVEDGTTENVPPADPDEMKGWFGS